MDVIKEVVALLKDLKDKNNGQLPTDLMDVINSLHTSGLFPASFDEKLKPVIDKIYPILQAVLAICDKIEGK